MNQSSDQQQLHEALRQNWKAASWHSPCGFLEKLPFLPPLPQENLTFHLLEQHKLRLRYS